MAATSHSCVEQPAAAQAKSGTGKTVTFGIIILDALNAALAAPQALVVEPTREVALQVQRTIAALCRELPLQARTMGAYRWAAAHACGLAVRCFRGRASGARGHHASPWWLVSRGGGHPRATSSARASRGVADRTPTHLGALCCACLLVGAGREAPSQVFDEADTLLAGGFIDDIAFVYGALPARKQARTCAYARSRVQMPH